MMGGQIPYTRFAAKIMKRTTRMRIRRPSAIEDIAIATVRTWHYSRFCSLFEAQSLGGVLPFIRAHRPKLPHPVYAFSNYRMRSFGGLSEAPQRDRNEQEIHPRRFCLQGIAPGIHRAGA